MTYSRNYIQGRLFTYIRNVYMSSRVAKSADTGQFDVSETLTNFAEISKMDLIQESRRL